MITHRVCSGGSGPSGVRNGFRKSTPPQNRQLNISISNSKNRVDNSVGELTFSNSFMNTLGAVAAAGLVEFKRAASLLLPPGQVHISYTVFETLFCRSQSPYKPGNLYFTVTGIENNLTDMCGK